MSTLAEVKQFNTAIELIKLGARMQLIKSEAKLIPYAKLSRLYKEVKGRGPTKGLVPFSTEWFIRWQPNIHASLFMNIHEHLNKATALSEIDVLIKAYKLYLEQMSLQSLIPLVSITRTWTLVKFMNAKMLAMTTCSRCRGQFVTYPYETSYVCGLCNPTPKSGKGAKEGMIHIPKKQNDKEPA
jgi:flagellar transcriptional activator FlhC